jgi:hypothetical protein
MLVFCVSSGKLGSRARVKSPSNKNKPGYRHFLWSLELIANANITIVLVEALLHSLARLLLLFHLLCSHNYLSKPSEQNNNNQRRTLKIFINSDTMEPESHADEVGLNRTLELRMKELEA